MEPNKIRVLIVDDKEEARYLLETLLKGVGNEVASAGNGAEALDRLRAQDFDIIITDILMPVMDGFQLCLHVKQDDRLRGIPLVFYTATYVDENDEDLAMMMGAHGFIRKPEEPKEFIKKIGEIVTEVREGRLHPKKQLLERHEVLLQLYNTRVVNKLHQKMRDLEKEIVQRKKIEEELKYSERLLAIRDKIARIFLMVVDDKMYEAVLEVILEVMQSEYGVFGYIDDDGAWVCPSMTRNVWDKCRIPDKDSVFPRQKWGGIWGRALSERRTFCSNAPLVVPEGHVPLIRAVAMPIIFQKGVLGCFVVANKETDYGEKDLRLLETIANYIAPVLHSRLSREKQERKRRQAEDALKESEERYRAVFDNVGIGIKVIGIDKRIERANRALTKFLGYTEKELLRLTPLDITHPDDEEVTERLLNAVTIGKVPSGRLEKRYVRKDGRVVWGDISISAIRDAAGNPMAAVEVIADVTQRQESQTALIGSEERMRLIIDSAPVGIRILKDGRYVYVNPSFATMFGYESQDEIVGLPAQALFAAESKALILQRISDRAAGKSIGPHYEAIGLTKNGRPFALEAWGTEVNYQGERASLAFVMDVSESKSLRSQLFQAQKMESIGTLAGGIAHDFNNLLTVILGYSDLLLVRRSKRDPAYQDLQRINYAARNGADLVKRILAFSRKAEITPRPLDLNYEIGQIKELIARTIPKMIEIKLVLSDELPTINADPTQIEQILMNLAVNARDAMPDGGKFTIETNNMALNDDFCRLHPEVEPGDYVLLSVSDTGHGMEIETLQHIFEPFFTTKGIGQGTGLGLAMVHGIVRQHGGVVTCSSKPGIGTTFRIYLPVMPTEAKSEAPADEAGLSGGTETILLVDDEEMIRDFGKTILELSGYTVLTAATGKEALSLFDTQRDKISLVILDLIMPDMGGNQCLEKLLKIDPQVKVLIASGFAADGLTKKAIESGSRGLLAKPYDSAKMLKAVREVLDAQ